MIWQKETSVSVPGTSGGFLAGANGRVLLSAEERSARKRPVYYLSGAGITGNFAADTEN